MHSGIMASTPVQTTTSGCSLCNSRNESTVFSTDKKASPLSPVHLLQIVTFHRCLHLIACFLRYYKTFVFSISGFNIISCSKWPPDDAAKHIFIKTSLFSNCFPILLFIFLPVLLQSVVTVLRFWRQAVEQDAADIRIHLL